MLLSLVNLYPILDTAALENHNCSLLTAASAILASGACILQIRHKRHWSRGLFRQAEAIANLSHKHGAELIVNDRADFALLLGAGLHLGQDDLPPEDARALIGPSRALGFSTHNADQLRAAAGLPVTYLALGPIFSTTNKDRPSPEVGLANLSAWRSLTEKPLVAIGGITRANASQVLAAGANSLAVIAGLLPDPCTELTIRKRMDSWHQVLCEPATGSFSNPPAPV